MSRFTLAAAVAAAALALSTSAVTPALADGQGSEHRSTEYYLSLGDSLAAGVQPDEAGTSVATGQGFTDQLYAMLSQDEPSLRVQELGCPGETTTTLNNGGICGYAAGSLNSYTADTGSQLGAALTFLAAHRGHVPLITIVIGANDILPCLQQGAIDKITACLQQVLPVVQQQLADTLAQLRRADPRAMVVGMTYYDPELAYWLTGPAGQAFATQSISLTTSFRTLLTGVYQAAGARVADVYTAFNTADTTGQMTLPGAGSVPENVGMICELTWMCAPSPQGPNIHANAVGYGVIAQTFLAAIQAHGRDNM
jgi:lysophospholipase L1-like esterase